MIYIDIYFKNVFNFCLLGLVYLYDDVLLIRCQFKLVVVYRDFKSKNVLLKEDLIVCIVDFGLVLKFELGKSFGEIYGLVNILKYLLYYFILLVVSK